MSGGVVGVIQARLGSTRLPRKVLADLHGAPMLQRIAERALHASAVDRICIATTTDASDDDLVAYAAEAGVACHRGPVDDIVERLCGALEMLGADVLVRIWGDCPFIDPGIIDRAIGELRDKRLDYISNSHTAGRTYPAGLDIEIYTRETLLAIQSGTTDPFYREFPFEYVAAHRDTFTLGGMRHDEDLSHLDLCVDYPQDLEMARAIYAALHDAATPFSLADLLGFLQLHPEVLAGTQELARNVEYHDKKAAH